MWDLPRPGLEPVSPALAGRFSTTAPPGKPNSNLLMFQLPGCCCKNSYLPWLLAYLFGAVPQSYLRGCIPAYILSFVHQIKHNSQLFSCALFFFFQLTLGRGNQLNLRNIFNHVFVLWKNFNVLGTVFRNQLYCRFVPLVAWKSRPHLVNVLR